MSARASDLATKALTDLFAARQAAPAQNVAARAGARKWRSAEDELEQGWKGVADELDRIAKSHDVTGTRIDAWQELPKGSAPSVAEANALVDVVDAEIGRLKGVQHRLTRTRKAAADIEGAAAHFDALDEAVTAWLRDAESDRENLLVAARAILPREKANGGGGIVEIPVPVQVERALAEAYTKREARDDEVRAVEHLPKGDARTPYAQKLLAAVQDEMQKQQALAARVQAGLDAARDAGMAPPAELRAADDRLRAWAIDLAHSRSRVQKLLAS